MSGRQRFYWVVGGMLALLLVTSIVGAILRARVHSESGRAVVGNLNSRILTWWAMMAIFAFAFLADKRATLVLFALMSFFALREFITLSPTSRADHAALSLSFFVLVPTQYMLIGFAWYGMFAVLIPVYAFLILPAVAFLGGDTDRFLERMAKIQWGVMITVFCFSHVAALLVLNIPAYQGQNALLIFYLLLVAQLSDVLQYVVGKIYGRTKIAPTVSRSKTVEGLVGGGFAAMLVGGAMYWITPFSPAQALGMSFVIVTMGFLGGLALAAVKRNLGVKDWGSMIEGHRGILDRVDSLSFAAPIFFHLIRYYFAF